MRIVGYVENTPFKITVFQDNGRISIKIENGMYEQVYKFRDGSGVDNLAQAQAFVDAEFIESASQNFTFMHQAAIKGLDRLKGEEEEEFDEII